jgi:hypothetical protein
LSTTGPAPRPGGARAKVIRTTPASLGR